MTKLALVLALAGVFVFGYEFGRRPARGGIAPKEASRVAKSDSPATEAPAPKNRGVFGKWQEAFEAPPVNGGQASVPPAAMSESANVAFARFMQNCQSVENSWREKTLDKKMVEPWRQEVTKEVQDLREAAQIKLIQASKISKNWRGKAAILIDGETVNLEANLRFNVEVHDGVEDYSQACWSISSSYDHAGNHERFMGYGGCGNSFSMNSDGIPVVQQSTYALKEVGMLVTALLIPVDVSGRPMALEYLPAAGNGEWAKTNFDYVPISDQQLDEERLAAEEQERRTPASQ